MVYRTATFSVTLNDINRLSEIFSDMKHPAISLVQEARSAVAERLREASCH